MVGNSKPSIQIDLNEFKLHLHLKGRPQLTLHFNSPSRNFYLSVIALVVNEMKKSGKIKSIPLQQHLDLLALLNETIGGAAGSSEKENLLHRIYKKWKDALPNLEEAPLFKVHGKKKKEEGDGAIGKVYSFTDAEKDGWANLFDYMGSEENVRLKFAIDKIGVGLNETSIIFRDFLNGEAWEKFISSLKKDWKEKIVTKDRKEEVTPVEIAAGPRCALTELVAAESSVTPSLSLEKRKMLWVSKYRWALLVVVLGIVTGGIWIVYLRPSSIPVASVERMKYPLPDRPSIAVLPFINISGDPKQEHLADGITEEITNTLSRVPFIFVIASNTVFSYKGKRIKIQQVSEELGVRYVVEGSLQRSHDRLRVTAQLIDALSGHHLWSERYDRMLKEIFTVQDEIVEKIVTALRVKLSDGLTIRTWRKTTDNVEAWECFIRGNDLARLTKRDENAQAQELLEKAISLDPKFAMAYAILSLTHAQNARFGWTDFVDQSLQRALEMAQKAVALDNSLGDGHALLGFVYAIRRDYEQAVAEGERAVTLMPNGSVAMAMFAATLNFVGREEEALGLIKRAMRLNPSYPPWFLYVLGQAHRLSAQYEEALLVFKAYRDLNPNSPLPYVNLAITYSLMGREGEAQTALKEALRQHPTFSLNQAEKAYPYKDRKVLEREMKALQKAGLK